MALHDFATVRLYDSGETLDVFFSRNDTVTRDVVKAHKGRWDRGRRCWRIEQRWAGATIEQVVDRIREAILDAAPKGWRESIPKLSTMCSVTRGYVIRFGEGGVRLEMPRGHKHEWTLRESGKAEEDDRSWLLQSTVLGDPTIKAVVQDVVQDDKRALAAALDYLSGFVIYGDLNLAEGEIEQLGLVPEAIIPVEPSFVRKVDQGIPAEPLSIYPMRVISIEKGEEIIQARLAFVTGDKAYAFLRQRLAPAQAAMSTPHLDMRHVAGRWSRRRAS